jgi:hypothetical protein
MKMQSSQIMNPVVSCELPAREAPECGEGGKWMRKVDAGRGRGGGRGGVRLAGKIKFEGGGSFEVLRISVTA